MGRQVDDLPPVGTVSHIRVLASNLDRSTSFYEAIGLIRAGATAGLQLMRAPKAPHWEPYVLLEARTRDTAAVEESCADGGLRRICLLVADAAAAAADIATKLEPLGIKPITAPVTDQPAGPLPLVTMVSFRDPDGVVIELVQMHDSTQLKRAAMQCVGTLRFPLIQHVGVNAVSYDESLSAYRLLGFEPVAELGRAENSLYTALGVAPPGIAGSVALLKLPQEPFFLVDLVQWLEPQTQIKPSGALSSIAITVENVAGMLEKMKTGGLSIEAAHKKKLPDPLGDVVVGVAFDPVGTRIELVSYTAASLAPLGRPPRWSSGRVALITGCDSGIGQLITHHAIAAGFEVVAGCYTKASAASLSSLAVTVVADLTSDEGVSRLCKAAEDKVRASTEGLWAIVNNAALCISGNVEWLPPSAYERVMALNFHAPVKIIYELLPLLKKSYGRVINVTSVDSFLAQPTNAAYSASKHAMKAFSDSLRCEMQPWGVKVVMIEPALMRTPLTMGFYDNWLSVFKAAPAERTAPYSDAWAEKTATEGQHRLEKLAMDPMETVRPLLRALIMKDPPTRIATGRMAHSFFKPLSHRPDRVRDKELAKFIYGEQPAGLQVEQST